MPARGGVGRRKLQKPVSDRGGIVLVVPDVHESRWAHYSGAMLVRDSETQAVFQKFETNNVKRVEVSDAHSRTNIR